MPPVYLDHNATTPLDPRVRDAMLPWLDGVPQNASSVHAWGQAAREAVEEARARVAALLGVAEPARLVFTASGTEALNAVILGSIRASRSEVRSLSPAPHLVISAIEHPAVLAAAARLEAAGVAVTRVVPTASGRVEAAEFAAALREGTILAALMLANNEVGTIQPVAEVAAECRRRGVPLLCDAVQAVGKIPVDVEALGVDYLVLGAHKFYGPLGAAALWVRPGASFEPLLVGGGQERRWRAGTENVPAIVGLGMAAKLAATELGERRRHLRRLRDRFEAGVRSLGGVEIHGAATERLPNTTHLAFPGLSAEALMIRLDMAGFAVSTGSACSSGKVEASATLAAMGLGDEEAAASLRVSFGATNDEAEVESFLVALGREVGELCRLSRPPSEATAS